MKWIRRFQVRSINNNKMASIKQTSEEHEEQSLKINKPEVKIVIKLATVSVWEFVNNWTDRRTRFKIFSYCTESSYKKELIDTVTGDGRMRTYTEVSEKHPWMIRAKMEHNPLLSHRSLMEYYIFKEANIGITKYFNKENKLVSDLWYIRGNPYGCCMLSKDLVKLLEGANVGRNKTHRIKLAPGQILSFGRINSRTPAVKLLMSV